jgi:methyl-accepting chemotaxis protein
MEEMAANIRQTAENARLTEGMALKSAEDAHAGKEAVTEIIQAMEVIAERISVVQEIAGQTNILSLNATIEAAKAQDFGKGFSVVASSVRDLARQSRAAADEIRTLVHSCVVLSAQAGEVLQRLVPNSEKTAELVQEINAAAQEQSNGVEHVNRAVQQLDSVTQHTAATAEQVAATAESLTTQADALQHTMAFFTVSEAQPPAPAKEADLLQRLQELEQQLAELRGAARPAAATAGLPQTRRSSDPPAPDHSGVIDLNTPTAGDERDQEFEHY